MIMFFNLFRIRPGICSHGQGKTHSFYHIKGLSIRNVVFFLRSRVKIELYSDSICVMFAPWQPEAYRGGNVA